MHYIGKVDQTLKVLKYYEHECGFPLGDKQRFLAIFGDNFPTIFGNYFNNICKIHNFQVVSISFQVMKREVFIFANSSYIWNEKKNECKRKHRVVDFFLIQEEKRPFSNLKRNKTRPEGIFFIQDLILLINVFQNSNILVFVGVFAGKSAKRSQLKT